MAVQIGIFFRDTSTAEIYTLSLHVARPIWRPDAAAGPDRDRGGPLAHPRRVALGHRSPGAAPGGLHRPAHHRRSEEHTSELQSRQYLVCRPLLANKTLRLLPFRSTFSSLVS